MHSYSQSVLKNYSVLFLCLQGLLVFPFNLGIAISVTLVLEEEFVESWMVVLC
jgi:hypothetical protein